MLKQKCQNFYIINSFSILVARRAENGDDHAHHRANGARGATQERATDGRQRLFVHEAPVVHVDVLDARRQTEEHGIKGQQRQ